LAHFEKIKEALEYIDNHLNEPMSLESLAGRFHFSPYYFHRMFSVIVGKGMAAHIRDRRFARACVRLSGTGEPVLNIALDCGYNSAQSFSRAFKAAYGISPNDYRKRGFIPNIVTVDEMIMKFTNRLRGGIFLNPKIIKRGALTIAGVSGDGDKTWDVWNAFEKLRGEIPLANKLSDNGYEIRLYEDDTSTVHVGLAVLDKRAREPYTVYELPAATYACFDVYVANGYGSENSAMDEWLKTNQEGYSERLMGNAHYCVEYYDERFHGSEAGSIVEIWIPVEKEGG